MFWFFFLGGKNICLICLIILGEDLVLVKGIVNVKFVIVRVSRINI